MAGAWCWSPVVPLLEGSGHRVVTPTLTGSGSRSDELTPEVSLSTHVRDVADAIDRVGSDAVLLVGHSYAGMILSASAPETRLAGLVYLDAFYPGDGDSALAQMPEQFQAMFRQRAIDEGDGWRLPANEGLLDVWGLHDPAEREWVGEQLTDWLIRCFEEEVRLDRPRLTSLPRTYVAAGSDTYPARAAFGAIAARAAADGCELAELPTGHDLMIEPPDAVAQVIDVACHRSPPG